MPWDKKSKFTYYLKVINVIAVVDDPRNIIHPEDQSMTTFTCPYGTYAYRRMSFGLCNIPVSFQRCMMSIFSNMIEEIMEVFMDDFSVYGTTFDHCLENLNKVLQRCQEKDLILN